MALLFGLDNPGGQETKSGSLLFGLDQSNAPLQPQDQNKNKPAHLVTNFVDTVTKAIAGKPVEPVTINPVDLTKPRGDIMSMAGKTSIGPSNPNYQTLPEIKQTDNQRYKFLAPVEDLPWYLRPGRVANDTIKDTSTDLFKRFQELSDSIQGISGKTLSDGTMETSSLTTREQNVDRVTKVASVGLGILNSAFLPFTTVFKAGEQLPGVGEIFKVVNDTFGKVGEVGTKIGESVTDSLPVSDETKKSLRPVLDETFALLSQIALGKVAHDVVKPKLEALEIKIKDTVSNDPQFKKLQVQGGADESKVKINTPKTKQEAYAKSQGYEPYTPPEQLPNIEMGKAPKENLPTIQIGEKTPTRLGSFTYEPIKEENVSSAPPEVKKELTDAKVNYENNPTSKSAYVRYADAEQAVRGKSVEGQNPDITPVEVKPIAGTGETRVRGLSKGVEEQAITNKLTKTFGDLPEYQTMNIKEQGRMTTDLINKDYEFAKDVALGKKKAPEGLHPEAVYTGVEARATQEGDVALLRDLATRSTLTTEATTMGQRIKLLDERNPDSPVKAIRDVVKTREESVKKVVKDVAKAKKEIAKEIDAEMKKVKPKKQDWASFIKELQC